LPVPAIGKELSIVNLADMLAYADIHDLNRIAKHYECECRTHSKHELIQSILSAIGRRETLERTLQSLTLEEQRFLSTLLFDKRDSFSLEELLAWVRRTRFEEPQRDPLGASASLVLEPVTPPSPPKAGRGRKRKGKSEKAPAPDDNAGTDEWSPRETILKFKQRGWLFNGHSQHTKYLFAVPRDLKRRIGESLTERLQRTLEFSDAPEVYRDEHDLLIGDVKLFLQFVHHREVLLTAEGFMYKRQMQQLLQSLQVREEPVQKEAWRFGYGRRYKEYPGRFSLIYDFCYYSQYITEDEERLRLTERGLELAVGAGVTNPADVYHFWIRLYKGAVPNIQTLVHWVNRLAEKWVTADSLSRTLCPFIRPYYYDSPESILERRILNMMLHLGLLRMGQHASAGRVVQMTELGKRVIGGTYVDERESIDLSEDEVSGSP
jgi:hypothetical protein